MSPTERLLAEHLDVTRRHFLRLGVASTAGLGMLSLVARGAETAVASEGGNPELAAAIARLQYFTPAEEFGTVERGDPLPYTHPPEKLREIGLTRDSWRLEIVPDDSSRESVENPLSIALGTALTWDGLMKLAAERAVRYLKVMTCNNGGSPLGMGLWEGVPLRDVVWIAKPVENVRRLYYYGYHNDDPRQMFRGSLPIGRVLEDPPGEYPVLLCYKLNGELLSGKRGGPVRMLVPEAYGFKSVKWLERVVLTNEPFANDTYAEGNNDVDSWLKTFARFVAVPERMRAGAPSPLTGLAQVGISGLSRVQYWLHPRGEELPEDDPYFTTAPWKDAEILPAPSRWTALPEAALPDEELQDGRLPADTLGFDEASRPREWPMRYALAHWAAQLTAPSPGDYDLRCRTLDARGIAQPLPRPFPKSGRNGIQSVGVMVEPA